MDEWKPTEIDDKHKSHICPRCGDRTETFITIDEDDGVEYAAAERCTSCRWVVDFNAKTIAVKQY